MNDQLTTQIKERFNLSIPAYHITQRAKNEHKGNRKKIFYQNKALLKQITSDWNNPSIFSIIGYQTAVGWHTHTLISDIPPSIGLFGLEEVSKRYRSYVSQFSALSDKRYQSFNGILITQLNDELALCRCFNYLINHTKFNKLYESLGGFRG